LPGAAVTYCVFDCFLDDAVQFRRGSSRDSLRPGWRHQQLIFDGRPNTSARSNRTFDELDQVPITVTAGTQLSHQIAKLRERFPSRALQTIDTHELQTLSLLLDS
jgi:hypothetical protein